MEAAVSFGPFFFFALSPLTILTNTTDESEVLTMVMDTVRRRTRTSTRFLLLFALSGRVPAAPWTACI